MRPLFKRLSTLEAAAHIKRPASLCSGSSGSGSKTGTPTYLHAGIPESDAC